MSVWSWLYFVLQSIIQILGWMDILFQDIIKGTVMFFSDLVFFAWWRRRPGVAGILGFFRSVDGGL